MRHQRLHLLGGGELGFLADGSHHGGYGWPEHVGVQQANAQTGSCGRDGEVHRHGRLADAALGGRNGDDGPRGTRDVGARPRRGSCRERALRRGRNRSRAGRGFCGEHGGDCRNAGDPCDGRFGRLAQRLVGGACAGLQNEAHLAVWPHDKPRDTAGCARGPYPKLGPSPHRVRRGRMIQVSLWGLKPWTHSCGGVLQPADQDFFAPVTRRTTMVQRPRST